MRTFDLITMCLRNLMRRKVRTFLTVIGVVVGTCAIVVMISIGIGMRKSQEEMLSQMGDLTVIEIYNWNSGSQSAVLDDKVLHEIMALPGVLTATPLYQPQNLNAEILGGKNARYSTYMYNVVGIYPEALPLLGYQLSSGDIETALSEPFSMLVGQNFAYTFRDSRKKRGNNRVEPYPDAKGNIPDPYVNVETDAMLIKLTLEGDNGNSGTAAKKYEYKPKVSGVMIEDWQRGYETSRGVFMRIEDLKKLEADYIKANKIKVSKDDQKGYNNAKVKVNNITDVAAVEQSIKDLGFETYSMESVRKPMEEQVNKQQTFLGIIAGVSLFVAALGIANTMLMSIYERTREIGVMKVVGCYVKDIRTVFLMEAGCIGFMGGVAGVILSYGISFLMNYFGLSTGMGGGFMMGEAQAAQVSIIPPWLILMALCFSTTIGIVSGYYPANRAVKISALSAIKQD